ncbi:major tail protein [Mediterraneibacter sp. ICN-202921]|uniref:major tail protein n=1 Tax=Mediterraneibacter sp. ICN-202921 TaxID=3134657 RepID=UPI0030C4AC57
MAYVGLRKPIIGRMNDDGTYGDPFYLGKAVGLQVTPNYAEGSLYADDEQAEYDKEFTYAEVTLNTSTIPIKAHNEMFGHAVDEEKKSVKFNKDDQNNNIGMGWISVEKVNGIRSFIGNFLSKVKFSEPSEDYSTKGESIEYKTPSITGRASSPDNGNWKETESFNTEVEARNWIYEKFGKSLEKLTVQSAQGTETGKTKLTVTPQKTGENTYVYKTGKEVSLPAYNDVCNLKSGWTTWDGTADVAAKTGDKIVVAEVTKDDQAKKAGETTVTAKTE